MSELPDDEGIACDNHGRRSAAFICQHLHSGSGLRFNVGMDPEDPDARCPDAWCNECEAVFQSSGEWTEQALAHADIKVVCDLCYESIHERSWHEEPGKLDTLVKRAVYLDR
jgi:hypothetical protein